MSYHNCVDAYGVVHALASLRMTVCKVWRVLIDAKLVKDDHVVTCLECIAALNARN